MLGKGQEVSPDKDVRAFRLASESVLPFFIALLYCPSLTGEGARDEREGFLTREGFLYHNTVLYWLYDC